MPTLDFKGKSVIETYHHTVAHHTLEFDPKLSLLPKGEKPSLSGNLIIEGDNLLALKALLPTHAGKIKCVYIDPPYNTGNEAWVYNDNLTQPQFKEWIGQTVGKEGEDATRHDKWCCMMYPRLQLLRELLSEDGSIWISADDNEFHHLRLVMNEVFGQENFVATIIWQKMDGPKNTAIHFSEDHDYILVYAKKAETWRPNAMARTEAMLARYENPDDDPRGKWLLSDLAARNYYAAGRYSITTPSGKTISGPPAGSYWRVSRERFDELQRDNRIWWGKGGNNRPGIKRFLSEVRPGVVPQTLWLWKDVGSTRNAKQELSQLMKAGPSEDIFVTPKPVKLLRRIVEIATDDGDIVLDSFAGSGTTGHAVLELNKESDADRQFILIQMRQDSKEQGEKVNLCKTLTAARIEKAIQTFDAGSFSYAHLGPALFNEYRHLGDRLPPFKEIAKYVFYTETSRECDLAKIDEKSGFIGSTDAAGGTSYYLFYSPNRKEDMELSLDTLAKLAKKDKNRSWVIYCERIWLHTDQIRKFERENKRRVRPMLVPFNLK